MAMKPKTQGPVDLFGNPRVSPKQLMQRQLAELLQETATRTAGADPRTAGVSMMGSALGGVIGQLLVEKGLVPKPPEVERAEKMEKARTAINEDAQRQGLDPTKNPGEFADLAASHFLRAGDEQSAMMAMNWKQLQEANQRVAAKDKQAIAASQAQELENLKGYTPASVQEFKQTGDYSKLVVDPNATTRGRGEYLVPVQTAEGVVAFDTRRGTIVDPATGKPIPKKVVGSTSDPALQGRIAGSKEFGKKTAGAKFDLPQAETNAARAIKIIDDAITDPALQKVTGGFAGRLPALFGEQARGVARIDQLKGGAFLTAYQELKGGGQITEVEGKKGEDAIARLNRAQDYDDFIAALTDLRGIIANGVARARKQAGAPSVDGVPTPSKPEAAKPNIDALLEKYGRPQSR